MHGGDIRGKGDTQPIPHYSAATMDAHKTTNIICTYTSKCHSVGLLPYFSNGISVFHLSYPTTHMKTTEALTFLCIYTLCMYVRASLLNVQYILHLLPPLFFRGASSGLGSGLAVFTGGGARILSIFFCTCSLRSVT